MSDTFVISGLKDNGPSGPVGIGGRGGDATVGGSGIAIAGPGGSVTNGGQGRGGNGGSALVKGNGIAAGGEGGSVDGPNAWYPPAISGYEVAQRRLKLPINPFMKQFGRAAMTSGYAHRFLVVEKLRKDYFVAHHKNTESVDANITAVPIKYINGQLEELGLPWRARITDTDQYEFFIP